MRNVILFAAMLLLTACGTKRVITDNSTVSTNTNTNAATTAFVRAVQNNNLTTNSLAAKMSLDLALGSKNVSLSGTLRMKKNDVIQLSLVLLFVEVARIEFTPKDVLILDRVRKQYVRATYDEVGFLAQAGLSYSSLQSLFWHELFAPPEESGKLKPERFQLSSAGNHTLLSLTDAPKLNYEFLVASQNHLIDRLSVEGKTTNDRGKFVWRYSDFTEVGGKSYPKKMDLNVTGVNRDITATISLSNFSTDGKWEGHTTPPAKYTQRKASEILKSLF